MAVPTVTDGNPLPAATWNIAAAAVDDHETRLDAIDDDLEQVGQSTATGGTGVALVDFVITFPVAYASTTGLVLLLSVMDNSNTSTGLIVKCKGPVTTTGFTARVNTNNGANFPSSTSITVNWMTRKV